MAEAAPAVLVEFQWRAAVATYLSDRIAVHDQHASGDAGRSSANRSPVRPRRCAVGPIVEPDYYAVVFAKSSTKLMNSMYSAMKRAWKDGTYHRTLAKWGLTGAAIPQPLINHGLQ